MENHEQFPMLLYEKRIPIPTTRRLNVWRMPSKGLASIQSSP